MFENVKRKLCYVEFQYVLQDKQTGERFISGNSDLNYFGHIFIIAPIVDGRVFFSEKCLSPWLSDASFEPYKDGNKYKPVLFRIFLFDADKRQLNSVSDKIKLDTLSVAGYNLISINAPIGFKTFAPSREDTVAVNVESHIIFCSTKDTTVILSGEKKIKKTSFFDNKYTIGGNQVVQSGFCFLKEPDQRYLSGVLGICYENIVYPLKRLKEPYIELDSTLLFPPDLDKKKGNDTTNLGGNGPLSIFTCKVCKKGLKIGSKAVISAVYDDISFLNKHVAFAKKDGSWYKIYFNLKKGIVSRMKLLKTAKNKK